MPPFDAHRALGHAEVAAWALGALDQPDAEAFGEHLTSCSECQAAAAQFGSVARALQYQVPDAEPPSDLETRTIAAVQYAAMTASQPGDACCR
jgi:anti-sigma factor RsiW